MRTREFAIAALGGRAAADAHYSPFVATSQHQVQRIVELASIVPADVVCDLGFGDASLICGVLEAAGCSGIGCEVDGNLVSDARASAAVVRLGSRLVLTEALITPFMESSAFDTATVVFLFHTPMQLAQLAPALSAFLSSRPGVRVISERFEVPGLTRSGSVLGVDDDDANSAAGDYFYGSSRPACFLYGSMPR